MVSTTPATPVLAIQPPNTLAGFTDPKGALTTQGNAHLQRVWASVSGRVMVVVCACDQTNVNVLKLTPSTAAPASVGSYYDFATFRFIAAAGSTNTVTASVGTLPSLPVYKTRGTATAGNGDVVANAMYDLIYASALNGGSGGFVLW